MKLKIFLPIALILIFLFSFYVFNLLFNMPHSVSDTDIYASPSIQKISDIPQKIKITKYFEHSLDTDLPYICYISDFGQKNNFINTFNSLLVLSPDILPDNINELYKIEFINSSSYIVIDIFDNNYIKLTDFQKSYSYSLSNDEFTKIKNIINVKYYLHNSTLPTPSDSDCITANSIIFNGISLDDKKLLCTEIRNIHSFLEYELASTTETIKDSNNIYWPLETTDMVYTSPSGVKVQSFGLWKQRDELKELLKLNINETLHKILDDCLKQLQLALDNHDYSELFEVHKKLHDLDYWIINYPLETFKGAPVDWGGLNCYYDLIEIYNLY